MSGKKRRKKKWKTLDKVLLGVAVFLIIFIAAMIVTFWRFQSVPDALIDAVLRAGGVEAVITATITIVKLFKEER